MSIGEVKRAAFRIQKETILLFYRKSIRFAIADLLLGIFALFINPYRACRKKGDVYGETPAASMQRIASFCNLGPNDVWLDLGSGRGKGAIGIEKIPTFVFYANFIAKLLGIKKASFKKGDLHQSDLTNITCIYLYSTCMEYRELLQIAKKMAALPKGAKIVTVSGPLPKIPHLQRAGSFPLEFLWGSTEGYLHIRK